MRRPAAILIFLLVPAVLVSAVSSVAATLPTVREIRIQNVGAGQLDETFVLSHVSARRDAPLEQLTISRDVRALLDTDRFSDVSVAAESLDDDVRLVYSLRNKLKLIEAPAITGLDHFREGRVRGWLALQVGDLIDDQTVGTRVKRLLKEYGDDFYPDAKVTWSISETDHTHGLATVSLRVKEGRKSRVKRVTFAGNTGIPERALKRAVKVPAWWNPFRWLLRGKYDADELEAAKLRIREMYLNRGFLDVEVDIHGPAEDARGILSVGVEIREGTPYRLGRVAVEGASLFPEAALHACVAAQPGERAASAVIRRSAESLRDFYGARGYVATRVRPILDPDKATATVDVTFRVREGRLVRIRNIVIRGNTRTRDKVVRRELLVYPGDIYNEVKVKRSERRISNLGFFGAVRATPERTPLADERDLVIEVAEKRTGQFMMGAGFSSIEKIIGYVELSQGNFDIRGWPYLTGGGQKLRLRAQFGSNREDYQLSFVEPWFLDRKLSLGFDLYSSDVSYSDYDVERTGGAVTLGKALPGPNRLSLKYRLEQSRIRDIADTNRYFYVDSPEEEYYFTREEDRVTSSLKLTLTHDTRDNPFFPTRGNKVSMFGRVAGGVLGCDTDLYTLGMRSSHYLPLWWGHVLNFRTRYEVVEAYGDTEDVPISDRLFSGGGRTIRGYDYRDVGPKVFRQVDLSSGGAAVYHRPAGGGSLAQANVEYTVPLAPKIRLAAFYDAGNVWRDTFELQPDDVATSAGVGIRLDMPGFPIRIDRAWDVDKDDELTDTDPWVIWIGYDM